MINKYLKTTILFGCILAIINIFLAQILKIIGVSPFSSINNITFIPVIIALYLSIKTYRKITRTNVNLKSAISVSLLTNIISSLIISIFTYAYFSIYSQELHNMKEQSYKEYINRERNNGVDKNNDMFEMEHYIQTNYTPLKLALYNFTFGLFLSMVLSIIISILYTTINKRKT